MNPKGAEAGLMRLHARFGRDGHASLRRRAARGFARGRNARAVEALAVLAERGDSEAAFQIGACYEQGLGVLPNFVEAARWYERAAEGGSVDAMERLGDIYLSGRIVSIGGQAGVGEAEAVAAGRNRLRPRGLSVARDAAKAAHWNRLAAERGNPQAQARLGGQYAAGLGVIADRAEAEKWFAAAAMKGCPSGQFGLGALYASDQASRTGGDSAMAWFERAAVQGHMLAKLALGQLLVDGAGGTPDFERGAEFLTQAAEAGIDEAMFRLGELHCRADFAGRKRVLAETWLGRAAARGHRQAQPALARLLDERSQNMPADREQAAVVGRRMANLG